MALPQTTAPKHNAVPNIAATRSIAATRNIVPTRNIVRNSIIATTAHKIAADAREGAAYIAHASSDSKNNALKFFADQILDNSKTIISANKRDIKAASNLSDSIKDRLLLDKKRIQNIADGIDTISSLPDPIGKMNNFRKQPSGIKVGQMRVPLGVILAIYESRPNVTADIASLALKSGNSVILRGGSEALHSNTAIGVCLTAALKSANIPEIAAQVISLPDRSMVDELLACDKLIDLVIPRGGQGLIQHVAQHARMPVLKHLDGNCHVYVDEHADLEMAEKIILNAKTRRYGVCSAAESLLFHAESAKIAVPKIVSALQKCGVEIRGCPKTRKLVAGCKAAIQSDWRAEYLAPVVSVKIVGGLDDAIAHINTYGSAHTDAIVTDNARAALQFLRKVDSSSVMHNTSTAFADGAQYGLGAEVGISTGKLHARGPVGLEGLTCWKYIVRGNGAVRS